MFSAASDMDAIAAYMAVAYVMQEGEEGVGRIRLRQEKEQKREIAVRKKAKELDNVFSVAVAQTPRRAAKPSLSARSECLRT